MRKRKQKRLNLYYLIKILTDYNTIFNNSTVLYLKHSPTLYYNNITPHSLSTCKTHNESFANSIMRSAGVRGRTQRS